MCLMVFVMLLPIFASYAGQVYCMQVLKGSGSDSMHRKRIFIGCDEAPLTFTELVDACKQHAGYKGDVKFVGTDGPVGKTITGKASQKALDWTPKYDGFVSFMKSTGGKDWYSEIDALPAV